MEVENDVKFTDIPEVPVKAFHIMVNQFKNNQLVVFFVTQRNEVQAGISFVNYFVLVPFDEVGEFAGSSDDHHGYLKRMS